MANGQTPAKKGLSPLAWIAIGCGGLTVLGIIALVVVFGFGAMKAKQFVEEHKDNPAKAAAEMMVRLNPELDLVDSDDEAGTLTIRNKKTGEEATVNFEDIAEGRIEYSTSEGDFSIDASGAGEEGGVVVQTPEGETRFGAGTDLKDLPDWVPLYPGATEVKSGYQAVTNGKAAGMISSRTSDGIDAATERYKEVLEDAGYTINTQHSTTTGGASQSMMFASREGRTVNVVLAEKEGMTEVVIQYGEGS